MSLSPHQDRADSPRLLRSLISQHGALLHQCRLLMGSARVPHLTVNLTQPPVQVLQGSFSLNSLPLSSQQDLTASSQHTTPCCARLLSCHPGTSVSFCLLFAISTRRSKKPFSMNLSECLHLSQRHPNLGAAIRSPFTPFV